MIGRTIAHYEITGKLGEGAMGEVYRATDSRLKRDVAIKLISSRLAADPELVARLRREAEVLASLNHTNIGQIYAIEPSGDSLALVLELVEGQTLDERLNEGPLPLDRALKVAHQIAAALELAHEGGIIHRDLKPANIKRTPDGDVKVLDFGLAKGTQLNLKHTDLTADGAVIGTPAYMSPEQVAGKPLDRRTDIWSFGCVFYEMLTGSKAFAGDSVGSLFAAIATEPPDLEQIAKAPRPVRNLIERCLRKDPKQRLRDIGDARIELEELLAGRVEPEPVAKTPRSRFAVLAVIALLFGGTLALVRPWQSPARPKASPPPILRYSIALPSPPATLHLDSPTGAGPPLDVSPDGRTVVFAAQGPDGVRQLHRRGPGDALPRPIPGTEGAEVPFFSPDGAQVGFIIGDGGRMRRVSLSDDSVQKTLDAGGVVRGASWGPGDRIVFGYTDQGLRQVSAGGGESTRLTQVTPDELHHRWPQILPDGEHVLFTVQFRDRRVEPRIVSIDSGEMYPVGVQGSLARYLHGGYILYMRSEQLWAVRFDLATRLKVGDPVRVVSGIHVPPLGNPHLAVTTAGVLVYEPRRPPSPGRSLVWVDRKGVTEVIEEGKGYEFPRLSPDGGELILNHHTETNSHEIWRINLKRSPPTATNITSRENLIKPTWSPDGKSIIFTRFGDRSFWIQDLDGGKPRRKLFENLGWLFPLQWRNGTLLLTDSVRGGGVDLVELKLDGFARRTLVKSNDAKQGGAISGDGRWLAYVSDKTAQPEVYLRSYPDIGPEERVSTDGGTEPLWSRDGRELFYRKGRIVLVVKMDGDQIGDPTPLFEGTFVDGFLHTANYDISPDGTRFVMVDGGWGLTQGRLDVHLQFIQELEAAFARQK